MKIHDWVASSIQDHISKYDPHSVLDVIDAFLKQRENNAKDGNKHSYITGKYLEPIIEHQNIESVKHLLKVEIPDIKVLRRCALSQIYVQLPFSMSFYFLILHSPCNTDSKENSNTLVTVTD